MAKKAGEDFGAYIRTLRKQRGWTQEDLACRADNEWTSDTIEYIEGTGSRKRQNFPRVIAPLAKAFGLNDIQKIEFYERAGLVYRPKSIADDWKKLSKFLEELTFPAAIRSPIWDFIAFNSYHEILWGYTPETVKKLDEGIGPNLLRVLFDDEFRKHQTARLSPRDLERVISIFRTVSFRYVTHWRYEQVVNHMRQSFPDFNKIWIKVESNPPDISILREPINSVNHSLLKRIDFMPLQVPSRYVGEENEVMIYIPMSPEINEKLKKYAEDYTAKTGFKLRQFRRYSLE